MRKPTGGPVFPILNPDLAPEATLGIRLRQWYAGQAVAGLLAADVSGNAEYIAQIAFHHADAMIAHELGGK